MTVISNIREKFNLDNLESKLDRFNKFIEQESILKSELQSFIKEQYIQEKIYKSNLDSCDNDFLKFKIEDKFDKAKVLYNEKMNEIKGSMSKIQKDKVNLLGKNEELASIIKNSTNKTCYADAIVINEKNEILLLKRTSNSEFMPDVWGLPGGHIDLGEEPLDAGKRELKEETDLTVYDCDLATILETEEAIIYYYYCVVGGDVILDSNEHSNYCYFGMNDLDDVELLPNLKGIIKKTVAMESQVINNSMVVIAKGLENGLIKADIKNIFKDKIKKGLKPKLNNTPFRLKVKDFEVKLLKGTMIVPEYILKYKEYIKYLIISDNIGCTYCNVILSDLTYNKDGKVVLKPSPYKVEEIELFPRCIEDIIVAGHHAYSLFNGKQIDIDQARKELELSDKLGYKFQPLSIGVDAENNYINDNYIQKSNSFNIPDENLCVLEKAFEEGLIDEDVIQKAYSKLNLIKKQVWVTRGGKTFQQTVYVKDGFEPLKETPVGEEVTPEVKGLKVTQYSDKAIIIKGDTYVNLDLMKSIKKTIGVGSYNRKLKGWIFPSRNKEQVLGLIYSDVDSSGNEEKAEAVKNQKNELDVGTKVNIQGINGEIVEGASTSKGTKYNVKTEDGTKLNGVDDKVIETAPETNNKKIAEIINNTSAEGRVKSDKAIYGIKSIENIYNYSLAEYLSMNGIDKVDIAKVISALGKPKKKGFSNISSTRTSKVYTKKDQIEGLTKQQLISKLLYKHYQAVQTAINAGKELKPSVLATYETLQVEYDKKRVAMSEETKRKISEALKKNKLEETTEEKAKKVAQDFIDSIPEEELKNLKESFKSAIDGEVEKEQGILADLLSQKEKAEKLMYDLYAKEKVTDDYMEKRKLSDEARNQRGVSTSFDLKILRQKNKVQSISNGGSVIEVTDKIGVVHTDIPDFRKIDTGEITYNVDTILTEDKPKYIPTIDEAKFENGSFIFDAIKVDDDSYMIATNKYEENPRIKDGLNSKSGEYTPDNGAFTVLTLDQLVLTQDYYVTKKKAELKKGADERNIRAEKRWDDMDDKRKESYLMQKYMYRSIPAKVKKVITEEQWEAMDWKERETHYKPIKRYGVKKLKFKFAKDRMANSFHSMYERFVDPKATRHTKEGRELKRGETIYGTPYANQEVWNSWSNFRETMDWKINDINVQREEVVSDIRKKALETSYGLSNTNSSLQESDGILVKRQNGDEIKVDEIEQINNAWKSVQGVFGTMKENALKDNLVISHAGDTYMYASKAIGVFYPSMKAIGVTAKLGEDQIGFTLGHETAHWIDNVLGREEGRRHMSDNYDSTAGKIATLFRSKMNEKSDSKYINATHECFARALEQYHAIESQGKDALIGEKNKYIVSESYVSLETYDKELKPLIETFFKENKEMLKSMFNEFNVQDSLEILEKAFDDNVIDEVTIIKARSGVYADTAENKKLKRVGQKYGTSGKQEEYTNKKGKSEDGSSESKKPVEEQAKEASGSALEQASKEAKDAEVRSAAHQELDRRSKEEAVQEEKVDDKKEEPKKPKGRVINTAENPDKKKKEIKGDTKEDTSNDKSEDTTESLMEELKALREEDIDYSDEKALEENIKKQQEVKEKLTKLKSDKITNEAKDKGLSKEETDAIVDYTGVGYKDLNEKVRNGKKLNLKQQEQVNTINSGLEKLPKKVGKVYRGMLMPEDIDNVLKEWQKGGIVTMDSFTSTAKDKRVAQDFGTFQMSINSKTGRDISKLSTFGKMESEILFKTDSKFKVKSIKVKKYKDPMLGDQILGVEVNLEEV